MDHGVGMPSHSLCSVQSRGSGQHIRLGEGTFLESEILDYRRVDQPRKVDERGKADVTFFQQPGIRHESKIGLGFGRTNSIA